MSELQVEISLSSSGGTVFRPGETLSGVAKWSLDRDVKSIEVRLFWFTRGKGTQDVEIVDRITFDAPPRTDEHPFSFVLSEAPYSFNGTLISLTWAIEMVAKGVDPARNEFILSPFEREIDLTTTST